ncbi:hypothetical protein I4F81_012244 [Pyropia yezoensis]|uniref:Uncharacterized protein n=1 Tax=Pyropia yezoensis TaxID=2788 RepID=A0ACC3CIY6_PYRYE|nr:hypothetical protein I4F81_012244 [Neopyropia yezoensis]
MMARASPSGTPEGPDGSNLVLGPAGTGKSTYCAALHAHIKATDPHRHVHVVNLDPAATELAYVPTVDIRTLITAEGAASEHGLGPNGALVWCMEYLVANPSWLEDQLDAFIDGDTLLLDVPGQIELYTVHECMATLVSQLTSWDIRLAAVFLMDAQFLGDGAKFLGAALAALATMVRLAVPHVSVLSKADLLAAGRPGGRAKLDELLEMDIPSLVGEMVTAATVGRPVGLGGGEPLGRGAAAVGGRDGDAAAGNVPTRGRRLAGMRGGTFATLNAAIGSLLEDWNMVSFVPLALGDRGDGVVGGLSGVGDGEGGGPPSDDDGAGDDEAAADSLSTVLLHVDMALQYHEGLEVREAREAEDADEGG